MMTANACDASSAKFVVANWVISLSAYKHAYLDLGFIAKRSI